ncbi:hypothetical protein HDU84_006811, partial [Entophlyctis sp. JEL0112]
MQQANLIIRDPSLDAVLKYHSQDYSVDQANLSLALIHQIQINPLLESIAVIIQDRQAYETNQVGFLGLVLIPCTVVGINGFGVNCYGRIFMSPAGGPNIYMTYVDPVTGEDISPPMMNWENYFLPQVAPDLRLSSQLQSTFAAYPITSATAEIFALSYSSYFFANESDIFSLRESSLNIDCLSKLDTVFSENGVSQNSNMFLIDQMGLMLSSSVPNSFLAGKYGLVPATMRYAISENQTLDDVTIGSTPYIVATSLFYPPTTPQTFVLVFYAPRSDFY